MLEKVDGYRLGAHHFEFQECAYLTRPKGIAKGWAQSKMQTLPILRQLLIMRPFAQLSSPHPKSSEITISLVVCNGRELPTVYHSTIRIGRDGYPPLGAEMTSKQLHVCNLTYCTYGEPIVVVSSGVEDVLSFIRSDAEPELAPIR